MMNADTRHDELLARLQARLSDQRRACVECTEHILEHRLRALPSAVRCQPCEERREDAQQRYRALPGRQVCCLEQR